MNNQRLAKCAFGIGMASLVLSPFAVICGFFYALEIAGIHHEPNGVPFDWGFGGVLYILGLFVWLKYPWAWGKSRTRAELISFWRRSLMLNLVWIAFFGITLMKPHRLSSPFAFWAACAVFPLALLVISWLGFSRSLASKA